MARGTSTLDECFLPPPLTVVESGLQLSFRLTLFHACHVDVCISAGCGLLQWPSAASALRASGTGIVPCCPWSSHTGHTGWWLPWSSHTGHTSRWLPWSRHTGHTSRWLPWSSHTSHTCWWLPWSRHTGHTSWWLPWSRHTGHTSRWLP